MSTTCHQLKQQYEKLKQLKVEFERLYSQNNNIHEVFEKMEEIKKIIEEIEGNDIFEKEKLRKFEEKCLEYISKLLTVHV